MLKIIKNCSTEEQTQEFMLRYEGTEKSKATWDHILSQVDFKYTFKLPSAFTLLPWCRAWIALPSPSPPSSAKNISESTEQFPRSHTCCIATCGCVLRCCWGLRTPAAYLYCGTVRTAGVAAVAAAAGRGPIVCVDVLAEKIVIPYVNYYYYNYFAQQTNLNQIPNLGIVLQIHLNTIVNCHITGHIQRFKLEIYWLLISSHFIHELPFLHATARRSMIKNLLCLSSNIISL